MEEKAHFPRPIEAFLVIIVSFILVVLVSQVALIFLMPDSKQIDRQSPSMKVLLTFGEVGLIIVPLIYLKKRKYPIAQVFRWNRIPLYIVLWSIIIGFSISIIGDELDRLISLIIPAPDFLAEITEALLIHSTIDFFILSIGAVLAAALVEESIIRGFLQLSLEKYQDVTRAVIYASLAWTIIHAMLYWAIQIFLLGIILGIIAWKSNSIFPSAIGHAINNAMALFFYNVKQEHFEGIYLWSNHVSPFFLIVAMLGLIWGVKAFYRYYQPPSDIFISPN